MRGRTRTKRGKAVAYSAGVLFMCLGVVLLLAAQNGTWQGEALAQALEINADTSRGVLAVTANLAEDEILSIEVMGPGSRMVVDEDVASSSFTWAPGADNPDGLYRYEIQAVDKATGNMISRKAGTFTIRGGELKAPREISPSKRNIRQGMFYDVKEYLAAAMNRVTEFLVPEAEAVDLRVESASPVIFINDTQDEDCSSGWDWLISAEGGTSNADGNNFIRIYGTGEGSPTICGASVPIVEIYHDGAVGANSSQSSLVIDPNGDLRFASDRMFFDRSTSRLGINNTTPSYIIDAVGTSEIMLRQSTAASARSIAMRNDGSATDLEARNADLWIRADLPAPDHNIYMLSNRVGVGTTSPDSKLHVIGGVPPQFIVQNNAGNARMDFRRSSAAGVSQLLFGTGPLVGGTMNYQVGMFNNTIFQIRVTNDSTKGIALTTGGNVGIGTIGPGAKLDVAGTVNASGGYTNISDVRMKDNVEPIRNALGKVTGVEGVSFTWKKDADSSGEFPEGTHYGVVAQQVEKVMPEVVRTAPSGEKSVSYTELVPVLIEAIKEQQKVFEAQQKIVAEQQKIIAELCEEIAAIRMWPGIRGNIAATSFRK